MALTGDLTHTLTVPVNFGQALDAAFSPQPIYGPGAVEIPYTFTSTGQLEVAFTATITLTDSQSAVRHSQFDIYLSAGDTGQGALLYDLPTGIYTLTYDLVAGACSLASGQQSFTVAPATSVEIGATTGRVGTAVLVTATVTNTGSGRVDGMLQAETSFDLAEVPFGLELGETRTLTATLDSRRAPAGGTYTLTVGAWANGALLDQVEQLLEVPRPDWRVSMPEILLIPGAGTEVPMTVENEGGLGAPFTLTLDLHGLYTADQKGWADPGEVVTRTYAFTLPADVEARTAVGHYRINGLETPFTYTIAGYQLDMSGHLSPRVADEGQAITATVWVTDTSGLGQPIALRVQLAGVAEPQMTTITLTHSAEVSFVITAPEQSALLSYGLYHPDGRSLLLDTLRLYVSGDLVGIHSDRTRYLPGETVELTALAQVTGTLTWQAFEISGTLTLTPGMPVTFAIPLAGDLTGGTYRLWYLFEGPEWDWVQDEVAFEVEGDRVEVRQVTLTWGEISDQKVVSGALSLRSLSALEDVVITGQVIAPDGTELVSQTMTVGLPAGASWVALPPLAFTYSQAGSHWLGYRLTQGGRELASGWQACDVPGPLVLGVNVPRAYYLPTQPVTASVALLNEGTMPATLTVTLDGQPVAQRVILEAGYQVEALDLGLLPVGVYTLSAQLTDSAGRASQEGAPIHVTQLLQVQVSSPDGLEGWHVMTPTVWLWPEIEGSSVYYQWDGGAVQSAVGGWAEIPAGDGQHDLAAWAELPDGSVGPVVTATLWLDREPPEVKAVIERGTPVTLTVVVSDSTSGAGWIGYWGDDGWLTYTAPLTVASVQTTTVVYQARDRAGNSSATGMVEVPPVDQGYGLELGADTYSREGPPGGTVAHTLRVTNTGVAADTYTVTVVSGVWPARGPVELGPLDAAASTELVVVVEIPLGAAAGESDVLTLAVTSVGDPAQSEERLLTTKANVIHGVGVEAGRTRRTGAPGAQVSYRVRVTNQGNDTDTFDVTVTGNEWPVSTPATVGPLGAGMYEDIDVTVDIPASATPGESDVATVTVTSQGDLSQSAGVTLTTDIAAPTWPHCIYLPIILRDYGIYIYIYLPIILRDYAP